MGCELVRDSHLGTEVHAVYAVQSTGIGCKSAVFLSNTTLVVEPVALPVTFVPQTPVRQKPVKTPAVRRAAVHVRIRATLGSSPYHAR